jgi:hypothetical protein
MVCPPLAGPIWSQILASLPGTRDVVGFGASDCSDCPAHLVYLGRTPIEEAAGEMRGGAESELVWQVVLVNPSNASK